MMTEAITHGQAGAGGSPANGNNTRATTPAPIAMSEVVETVSKPPLVAAFQPAWQAAANSTAAKTREPIALPHSMRLEEVVQRQMHQFGRDLEYQLPTDPAPR